MPPLGLGEQVDGNQSMKRYRHCVGATHRIETTLNIPIVGVYEMYVQPEMSALTGVHH